MEWASIVLGIGCLSFAVALCLGFFLKDLVADLAGSVIFLIAITFSIVGIVTTYMGLRKK